MQNRRRALISLLPLLSGLCLALPGASGSQPVVRSVGDLEARVAVRSGEPAPVAARFGSRFDGLAAFPGGLAFIDGARSTLFRKDAYGVSTQLVWTGQPCADGVPLASVRGVAAGADGTIAFLGILPDRREGIFRIRPGQTAPELLLLAQDTVEMRDGAATVGFLYPPAVEAEGAVVASVGFAEVPGAIVRLPVGAPPQVLLQSGDPLGPGALQAPLSAPAVNASGRIAFTASLDTGETVLAVLPPGQTPILLALYPTPLGPLSPFLTSIPPAINAAGQVAFLLMDRGSLRVLRTGDGITFVVAAPNSNAPGGGRFTEITEFPPAIDGGGKILFGALRSNGRKGFYLSDGIVTTLAEEGMAAGAAGTITGVEPRPERGSAAALGPGSVLHVAAAATAASGIFTVAGGVIALEVGSDQPVPDPRFVTFLDTRVPAGGGGPAIAPGGAMIFDARVTGGARGLFVRDASGAIRSVALDGDDAPGGGRFSGDRFAFASLNENGVVAFLGQAVTAGQPSALSLFYGTAGGSLVRVVDTELLPPSSGQQGGPGSGDRVKASPSRVNRTGQIAVPLAQADGTTVLMGYDGTSLFRIAGPGDPAPGGGSFATAFTGSMFTGQPVPPVLDDDGRVLFGAQSTSGESALYAARLAIGGGGVLMRLLGAGDEVDGGRLSPFELQALDADASGTIAFEAIYSDEFDFAGFVTDGGPAVRLAARFDPVLDRGFVLSVLPLLAVLEGGKVGYGVTLFDGSDAILVAGPGTEPELLAASGEPAPGGGVYLSFRSGARNPGRLASDGRGTIAFAASTTAAVEEIVLFGRFNAPPAADAGADRLAECAGPGGTAITLDGGASSDPDGNALQYLWTWPGGEATGARPTITLPLGVTLVTLTVGDGQATSAPDTVRIEVRDTLPPVIGLAASPSMLWPPDGRMVDVTVGVQVADLCDPGPSVVLVRATSSEPGSGRPGAAISGALAGTDDRLISLRADRSGSGPGRAYTLTYRAQDRSGNAAESTTQVIVPHDRRP